MYRGDMNIDEQVWQFIKQHRNDNVRDLALHVKLPWKVTSENTDCESQFYPDMAWVLDQISGWQTARNKLPQWAALPHIIYPPRVPMEQCSSQEAALYKAELVRGLLEKQVGSERATHATFADLTGGFGVDFAAIAQVVDEATYVERSEQLCAIAQHNFHELGLAQKAHVVHGDGVQHLAQMQPVDIIMLDPARRDAQGKRTYALADCEPNVLELLADLQQKARFVLVKLSPMLDWRKTVEDCAGLVSQVHIVSVKGECKELLLVLDMRRQIYDWTSIDSLHCVDIDGIGSVQRFIVSRETLASGQSQIPPVIPDVTSAEGQLLIEPNASVMKGGCFAAFAERYYCAAVGANSHLFVVDSVNLVGSSVSASPVGLADSPALAGSANSVDLANSLSQTDSAGNVTVTDSQIKDVPGKVFRIEQVSGMGKRELRSLTQDLTHANIAVRNAPFTPDNLRKKLKLKDGRDVTIFATTDAHGQHILIKARRI